VKRGAQDQGDAVGALITLGTDMVGTIGKTLGMTRDDAGKDRWVDRQGNLWEAGTDGVATYTDRQGQVHHPPGVDEGSRPDRLVGAEPGELPPKVEGTIVRDAEATGRAATPGALRRSIEEHRMQLTRPEAPSPLAGGGPTTAVARAELWGLLKAQADRGLARPDDKRVEPVAPGATPEDVGAYGRDTVGNIVYQGSDGTRAVTNPEGGRFTARPDRSFVLELPQGGSWAQDRTGSVTVTNEHGDSVARSFDPETTYHVTSTTGDLAQTPQALLERSLWRWSERSGWTYSLPLHREVTSPDGQTHLQQIDGKLFEKTPDGYFVGDKAGGSLTPVSADAFDRKRTEAMRSVESKMAATGQSRSEVESGRTSHMFVRGVSQVDRVRQFFGYASGEDVPRDLGYRYDPSTRVFDGYYLRKSDLEPETFGGILERHEEVGVAKINAIMADPRQPVTREWRRQQAAAHPVVANMYFPLGESVHIAMPITSETLTAIRLQRDADVFHTPLGATAAGVSLLGGMEYDDAMSMGRMGGAIDNLAGAAADTGKARASNAAISASGSTPSPPAIVGKPSETSVEPEPGESPSPEPSGGVAPKSIQIKRLPPGPAPKSEPTRVKDEPLPEGTHRVERTLKPRLSSHDDEVVLRANLEREEGIPVPTDHEAHHMVLKKGGGPAGAKARTILREAGISINDGANGVPLPRLHPGEGIVPEAATDHDTIHTRVNSRAVLERLEPVRGDPDAIRGALRSIRREILDGTFPR
jgi:hypothetical protein